MPLTDPVPSIALDVLQRNCQDIDKFVNQDSGSFQNRTGDTLTPIPVVDQQFQDALSNIGWIYKDPDTFTTGSVLDGPSDALRRASDGEYFRRISGPFPYTVVAGTNPVLDPLYVAVGSSALAVKLAADGGASSIGTSSGGNVQQALDSLPAIVDEAAERAETAADIAMTAGWIYATKADGEAVRTNGQYFWVVSPLDANVLDLYLMGASVAAATGKSTPSAQSVADILSAYPLIQDWLDLTIDVDGNFVYGMKQDGTRWDAINGEIIQQAEIEINPDTGAIQMPEWVFQDYGVPQIGMWQEVWLDSDDRFVWGMTQSGDVYRAINGVIVLSTSGGGGSESVVNIYDYDYTTGIAVNNNEEIDYLVIVNGQSWAEGAKSGTPGDATVTTVAQHPGYALMFNSGTKPAGGTLSSYVDLREIETSVSFETICSGAADVIMDRCNTAIGRKPRIIFAIAALGGQAYHDTRAAGNGLKKGTVTYAESLRLVKGAYDISKSLGKRLVVLAQVVLHGEQDFTNGTSVENYLRALNSWQSDFETDCQYITGQKEPIPQYVTQVNRGGGSVGVAANPALAQLDAPKTNHKIRCVGPMYQSLGGTDGAHLVAVGYRMVGRIVGDFICKDLLGSYNAPLQVVDYWKATSTTVHLKYNKPITVESDDTLVNVINLGAGKGVYFTDGSGSPVTVTGIAVDGSNADTLIVNLSGAWTGARPKLFIAAYRQGGGSGSVNGARSAIRSTASFDTDALTGKTQYYWACQQVINL